MTAVDTAVSPGRTPRRFTSRRQFDLGEAIVQVSVSSGLPAHIVAALVARADPGKSERLRRHPNTRALETNVARIPGFGVTSGRKSGRVDWVTVGVENGRSVEIRSSRGALNVRDQLLLLQLTTDFMKLDCPSDRRVPMTLNDLAARLGYSSTGGKTLGLVEESLRRLMAVVIRMELRVGLGTGVVEWHLIDRWMKVAPGSRNTGAVWLSEDYAQLVRGGNVTFIDGQVLRELAATRDVGDIAVRLYLLLEASQGPGKYPWHFPVFEASASTARTATYSPLVSILGLHDTRRHRILWKVGAAMAAIEVSDPRYAGHLKPSSQAGQTNLIVERKTRDSRGAQPRTARAATRDFEGHRHVRMAPSTSSRNVIFERPAPTPFHGAIVATIVAEHQVAPTNPEAEDAAGTRRGAGEPGSGTSCSSPAPISMFQQRVLPGLGMDLVEEWGLSTLANELAALKPKERPGP